MSVPDLPLVARDQIPDFLEPQVSRLEGLGADTTFHRFMSASPGTARFYWEHFYAQVFAGGTLPIRVKEVARLALAALSGCTFCRAGDVDSALTAGLTQEQVDGVLALDPTTLPDDERAAFALAVRLSPFSLEDEELTPEEWAGLQQHFDAGQLGELLMVTAVLAGVGRMLTVAGFVPRTCALPEPQPAP
jgi:AhpD family alkylhydroperoxidase